MMRSCGSCIPVSAARRVTDGDGHPLLDYGGAFFYVLVVALALALEGLDCLGRLLILLLRQLVTTLRGWGRTAQQVREIQRIGHRARRDMQQLYTDYMAQVRAPKER